MSNDKLCTLNEKCVHLEYTQLARARRMWASVILSLPHTHFIFLLLLVPFYSFVSTHFFIFMCVHFMPLCFIRIVWGHNRTNRRPHHSTHIKRKKKTHTQRERGGPKEQIKRDEGKRSNSMPFPNTFIGYEFLFSVSLFSFYYNQSNKLDIILGISAFACMHQLWPMKLPIGRDDSAVALLFHAKQFYRLIMILFGCKSTF